MAWDRNRGNNNNSRNNNNGNGNKQYAYSEIVGGLYSPPDPNSKVYFRGSFDVEELIAAIRACAKESSDPNRVNVKVIETRKSDAGLVIAAMGERNGSFGGGRGNSRDDRSDRGSRDDRGDSGSRRSFKDKWDDKPEDVDSDEDTDDDVQEERDSVPARSRGTRDHDKSNKPASNGGSSKGKANAKATAKPAAKQPAKVDPRRRR